MSLIQKFEPNFDRVPAAPQEGFQAAPIAATERDPLMEYYEWEVAFETTFDYWKTDYDQTHKDANVVLGMQSMGKENFITSEKMATLSQHLPAGLPGAMTSILQDPTYVTSICMLGGEFFHAVLSEEEKNKAQQYVEDHRGEPAINYLEKWAEQKRNEEEKQRKIVEGFHAMG